MSALIVVVGFAQLSHKGFVDGPLLQVAKQVWILFGVIGALSQVSKLEASMFSGFQAEEFQGPTKQQAFSLSISRAAAPSSLVGAKS